MKRIFESKNYPTIMYLSITVMLILIFFSFVSLVDNKTHQENKFTTLSIQDSIEKINELKTDIFYYFTLIFQFALIIIVLNNLRKRT